ncbi:MAG: MarC family protein, partial [Thermodesulfobacteriota bacterium]
MALISASILLFLVMDPFGNTPFFLAVLKDIPEEKRQRIILRELLIAFFILAVFIFIGPQLIMLLQVSEAALRISGGIILFLIAIKLIFGGLGEMMSGIPEGEPLIVPLAVPSIAGPSAVATIL